MKLSQVFSAAVVGVDALEVEIEVNASGGEAGRTTIVGLPDAAVRESQDRVWTALANSGFHRPSAAITINLAPADLRKEGPSFDLPIAVGIAALTEEIADEALEKCLVAGELALDGRVRPIKGALPMAIEARRQGRKAILVPEENAAEAAVVHGIYVYPIRNVRQAIELLLGGSGIKPYQIDREALFHEARSYDTDFSDVKGQQSAKRAIEVAAAGNHNLLLVGPPGTGKSMIAQRVPTIMPLMSEDEAIETTKIHSIAGTLERGKGLIATRPYRAPHHTISDAGLLGGGANPGPGEVSLAHHGVLFLDELPEFRRSTLEVLRQPLEDGHVTISRASGTMTFPAQFMLIAAMNPCPCGYFGDPKRACNCGTAAVLRYRQRISGPLLDRIDLHVDVPLINYKELSAKTSGETSTVIRERVAQAREIQRQRFAGQTKGGKAVLCNAGMSPRLMRQHCGIDSESSGLLEHAMNELNFSARAHDRILKVARTLADLEGAEAISANHVMEAIQYRTLDRALMG